MENENESQRDKRTPILLRKTETQGQVPSKSVTYGDFEVKSLSASNFSMAESEKLPPISDQSSLSEKNNLIASTPVRKASVTTYVSGKIPPIIKSSSEGLSKDDKKVSLVVLHPSTDPSKESGVISANQSIYSASGNHPLHDLSDQDLVKTVEDLQRSTKSLQSENTIFLHFLEKNDPSLLEGMDAILKAAHERSLHMGETRRTSRRLTWSRQSQPEASFASEASINPFGTKGSLYGTRGSLFGGRGSLFGSTTLNLDKEGPRINTAQKTELILQEMDRITEDMKKNAIEAHIRKNELISQIEEMEIREVNIGKTMNIFENMPVKYTQQKNPTDRFARYMTEWKKRTALTVDKLRLRYSSLKIHYQKICTELTQKQLLGENLQKVDFEQLHIENKHLRDKVEKRNLLLLELKKMNGQANFMLNKHKLLLARKSEEMKYLQDEIKFTEDKLSKIDEESDVIFKELEDTKMEYDRIKTKTETYKVPDVLDYVRKKADLNVLKKNIKIWERRKQIKDLALTASLRELKNLTGIKRPNKETLYKTWEKRYDKEMVWSDYEFEFERKRKMAAKERLYPFKKDVSPKKISYYRSDSARLFDK